MCATCTSSYRYKVKGALRAGCFAIAPHIADPRLPAIHTGWKPEMITFCGKVGKVIQVTERSVQLYSCGQETFWDAELFDASLTPILLQGVQSCKKRLTTAQKNIVMCAWRGCHLALHPGSASSMTTISVDTAWATTLSPQLGSESSRARHGQRN